MLHQKNISPEQHEKIGGLALYLSLIALFILSLSNIFGLLSLIWSFSTTSLFNILIALPLIVIGFIVCALVIPEKALVFMHETKHAVISGLAGNRWKNMHIDGGSGHFEYAYSKRTAHFNAMIALAPYFVPLVTIPVTAMSAVALHGYHWPMVALISFAYGIDLFSNIRDIDPRQTDFSVIRGGFFVGALYVTLANILIFTTLIAWCCFEMDGLKHLAFNFWHLVEKIVAWRLLLTQP